MTPQEQRIAIGLACGYSRCPCVEPLCIGERNMPDYLNDLNAMHEAEKTLTQYQRVSYFRELEMLVDKAKGCTIAYAIGDATAHQRAEAFLKTVDRWKEPTQ